MDKLVQEYQKIKKVVDDAKDQRSRTQGAFETAIKELKSKGFDTIRAAEEKIAGLKKQKEEKETEAAALLKEIYEEYDLGDGDETND